MINSLLSLPIPHRVLQKGRGGGEGREGKRREEKRGVWLGGVLFSRIPHTHTLPIVDGKEKAESNPIGFVSFDMIIGSLFSSLPPFFFLSCSEISLV